MTPFSDAWIDRLDAAVSTVAVDPVVSLTIAYVVGDASYRIVIADGSVRAVSGNGEFDVRISAPVDVANGVRSGERGALDSFMAGDLVVGGDMQQLMAHQGVLVAIGTAIADAQAHLGG